MPPPIPTLYCELLNAPFLTRSPKYFYLLKNKSELFCGVKGQVVHNASILTAVGCCGLQLYNFGETVSIPFWTETWEPDSFLDKIEANLERGLHTLCLLGRKKVSILIFIFSQLFSFCRYQSEGADHREHDEVYTQKFRILNIFAKVFSHNQ